MSDTTANQRALAWAERTLEAAHDGTVSEDAEAAARFVRDAILDPAEDDKPVTFDTLTEAEREAHIGAPVMAKIYDEPVDGFYLGTDRYGNHYVLFESLYGRLTPQYVNTDQIILDIPDKPRALIPGYTYSPDTRPDDARGWFADDRELGTVIVLTSQPDEDDVYLAFVPRWVIMSHRPAADLTNWRPIP